ncbi:MAG: septum formation inhibitor Maf [Clostridiales bacterium]|nr:septum formation inhibitor Maf [Clostridiales bacterium]
MNRELILASTSPRRQELLTQMGLPYQVFSPEVDEHLTGSPAEVVMALARRKALAAAGFHPGAAVLAADTLVHIQGELLGKPEDCNDAARMLRLLSGSWHEVVTGVCLVVDGVVETAHAATRVLFTALTEDEIRFYCESGEPMGKAGAYAIQGLGGMFISEIHGSYTNVVGLPTALVRQMLKKANIL